MMNKFFKFFYSTFSLFFSHILSYIIPNLAKLLNSGTLKNKKEPVSLALLFKGANEIFGDFFDGLSLSAVDDNFADSASYKDLWHRQARHKSKL